MVLRLGEVLDRAVAVSGAPLRSRQVRVDRSREDMRSTRLQGCERSAFGIQDVSITSRVITRSKLSSKKVTCKRSSSRNPRLSVPTELPGSDASRGMNGRATASVRMTCSPGDKTRGCSALASSELALQDRQRLVQAMAVSAVIVTQLGPLAAKCDRASQTAQKPSLERTASRSSVGPAVPRRWPAPHAAARLQRSPP
jgi:hypothetical protein